MEHRWNDSNRGISNYSQNILSLWHNIRTNPTQIGVESMSIRRSARPATRASESRLVAAGIRV